MHTETEIAAGLLRSTSIGVVDAARLVLELMERMGAGAAVAERGALLARIRRVLELGVAALAAEEATVSFREAALASVEARRSRRPSTVRDLRHFVGRLLRVEGVGERPLRAMTTEECRRVLDAAFRESVHSYRKGRAIMHSVFEYGRRRGWCAGNPVADVEMPAVEEHEIVPLRPEQVASLEATAGKAEHEDMRLSLHLLTYCGLRPAEVARLQPEDIRWGEREVVVRPRVSKTGGGRVVPLRCVGKLRGVRRVIPRNWQNRWRALRRAAGMRRTWQADVLRHTFATYHALYFRDLPSLQLEMGHRSLSLLRTRYVNACRVTQHDAKQFWCARQHV